MDHPEDKYMTVQATFATYFFIVRILPTWLPARGNDDAILRHVLARWTTRDAWEGQINSIDFDWMNDYIPF